jgi:hypothetical protein
LLVSGVISLAVVNLLTGTSGSKGIKKEKYVSKKTGISHTAIKQREEHIV